MADQEYDDSLLNTGLDLDGVDWDGLETGGMVAEGQYLALIKKVRGQAKNYGVAKAGETLKEGTEVYTGAQAIVMLQITEGPEKGKTIYDRIDLPNKAEEDWKKKKRLLIAKRCGLISRDQKGTQEVSWKRLEGSTVIIVVEHYQYGKNKEKTGSQLNTFKSYRDPALEPEAGKADNPGNTDGKAAYADI